MTIFPDHKLILEVAKDSSLFVKKVEITWNSEADIDSLLNEVFRPILIALSFTNDSINNAFNMNEWGESLAELETTKDD